MKYVLCYIVVLLTICPVISQTKIGLSFGSIFTSDKLMFNDPLLSGFPDRPFFQVGIGAQFSNSTVITVNYAFDLKQISLTTFVPIVITGNGFVKTFKGKQKKRK